MLTGWIFPLLAICGSVYGFGLSSASEFSFSEEIYKLTVQKCSPWNDSVINKIHILRIPKASSSALSVTARRAVGCKPAGPCCKYPGDPPGSCPNDDLFNCQREHRVIGCTNHYPIYNVLLDPNITSISLMREPIARSISAFYYPGIHHNGNCTLDADSCFLQYLKDPQWQNIVVKMLTGEHAYSTVATCKYKKDCNYSLELAAHNLDNIIIGVAEMWELSLLVLHCKLHHLPPLLDEYQLGSTIGNTAVSRKNTRGDYTSFSIRAAIKFRSQLVAQNELDAELYRLVKQRLWRNLHRMHLMKLPLVQEYWNVKSILT